MRLAIISDIHANIEALEAVFTDIDTQKVDQVLCLGDIVGYGVNPNECIETVKQHCPIILLGNHDAAAVGLLSTHHFNIHAKIAIEWTTSALKKGPMAFLHSLPLRETIDYCDFVHATPYEPNMWYYITSLEEAAFNFQFFQNRFCFVGHTHIPIIIVMNKGKEIYVHQDVQLDFSHLDDCRFLINVGSVGQPRDRDRRACYGMIDTDRQTFTYRRVEYNVKKTQTAMRKQKMPEFLIQRLEDGR